MVFMAGAAPAFTSSAPLEADEGVTWRYDADVPLIVPEVNNAIFSSLHQGVQSVAHERNSAVFLAQFDAETADANALAQLIGNGRVDGVIVHRGRVKTYRLTDAGGEQLVRIVGPGDFLGDRLLPGLPEGSQHLGRPGVQRHALFLDALHGGELTFGGRRFRSKDAGFERILALPGKVAGEFTVALGGREVEHPVHARGEIAQLCGSRAPYAIADPRCYYGLAADPFPPGRREARLWYWKRKTPDVERPPFCFPIWPH